MERQYKDSGIEWIGKIPETWEVDIAKHAFKQRREKGNDVECQLLAATQKNGMYPQHLLEGVVKVAADTDLNMFKTVHKNDYVISLRSFQGGFEMSDYEGVCSPAYQVFYATRRTANQYYKYLFKSDAFIQEINSLTVGIREGKNILYDDFALLPIPIPTVDDQQHIADYLDEKCGEIDSLIALQEHMIEKLKAYKQSVITEAVTKGLDPNAKLVPSGIDWIGEISEKYKLIKFKYIFQIIGGCGFKDIYQGETEGDYPFCKASDINGDSIYVNSAKNWVNEELVKKEKYNIIPKGSILISKIGEALKKNHRKINKCDCIVDNNCEGFSNKSSNEIKMLYYILKCVDMSWFDNQGTIPSINNEKLKNSYLPIPPICEQKELINYLDCKCTEVDRLIALKQQKIASLKDYKKSVIYEAVTGKTVIE